MVRARGSYPRRPGFESLHRYQRSQPSDLYETFKEILSRRAMWRPGDSVLVAVSGGPDSTCLLDLFLRLRAETSFPLAIAHLNHGLRGEESANDERFTASLARKFQILFCSRTLPEGSLEGTGEGLEAAARKARYEFLEETAHRISAARVALGHTRDDQAETFLLRLLRGAGPRGLAGIYPVVEGLYIRPLLEVSRQEVEAYLGSRGLPSQTDRSNTDLSRTRNRVRHHLLPMAREEFNPEVVNALARTAEILREEDAYLEQMTRDLALRLIRREAGVIYLALAAWRVLPSALQRRLLRHALEVVPSFDRLEAIQNLMREGRHGSAIRLREDLEARILYADLALVPLRGRADLKGQVPLPVPGEASLPELGLRLRAMNIPVSRVGDPRSAGAADRALLDADSLSGPLSIRARRPGDAFRPLGSEGESKLKSYLIDRKVPRPARDRIPLVVSGSRIAWVVGYQIDDRYKVTEGTRRVVVLTKEMQ